MIWFLLQVSFFSDGEETPSTPKADVLFVPRENPRALFIRHTEQTPPIIPPMKGTPDPRDIATPVQRNGMSDCGPVISLNVVASQVNHF